MDILDFEEIWDELLGGWLRSGRTDNLPFVWDYDNAGFEDYIVPILPKIVHYIIFRRKEIFNTITSPFNLIVLDYIEYNPEWLKEYDETEDEDVDGNLIEISRTKKFELYNENGGVTDLPIPISDRILNFINSEIFRLNHIDVRLQSIDEISREHVAKINKSIFYYTSGGIPLEEARDFTHIRFMVPAFAHLEVKCETIDYIETFMEEAIDKKLLLPDMLAYVEKMEAGDLLTEMLGEIDEERETKYLVWLQKNQQTKQKRQTILDEIKKLKDMQANYVGTQELQAELQQLTDLIAAEQKKTPKNVVNLRAWGQRRKAILTELETNDSQRKSQQIDITYRIYSLEKELSILKEEPFDDTIYEPKKEVARKQCQITNRLLFFGQTTIRYCKLRDTTLEVYFR